jgi:phosphatidyl-myo-inositol dimannoside synthase
MKIWIVAENWAPRRGGIENYLSHIAEQLGLLGHTVTVVVPTTNYQLPTTSYKNVVMIRRRFFSLLVRPKWLPLFIWLWRRAKEDRPDVLICGKALFEGRVGYYLKKHLGIPYIVGTYAMEIATWLQRRSTRRQLQRVLGEAHAITYINDVTKKLLQEAGADASRLHKLTPGVDTRFLRDVAPSLVESTTKHYGIRAPYVLSLGRLVPRKGFDTLIEAFSRLDQTKHAALKLVIVGDGPDRARLQGIVADNYIQTSVVWLTDVPDAHLPALYAGATLFALTPKDIAGDIEGFGIVYLEASALGIPTLGTQSGGVGEAVVDGETGILVEPDNPAATAAALSRLLDDATLRQRLGEQGKSRTQSEFQWAQRGEALQRLIQPFS